jgi:hypothetical protein
MADPIGELDTRYGDDGVHPTAWAEVSAALDRAELFWLTTVRTDGRPHVTPLIGLWFEDAMHFSTGPDEQKRKNLAANPQCALTTGANRWNEGLDLVVEGDAVRVTDDAQLVRLAEALEGKYGTVWHFDVHDAAFNASGHEAWVYRVAPTTLYAFAKGEFAQTRFHPDGA